MEDSAKKGRTKRVGLHNAIKTHCPHGHKYTKENTFLEKAPYGFYRRCKTCMKIRNAKRSSPPAWKHIL